MFCQYSFFGAPDPVVVAPCVNSDSYLQRSELGCSFVFNHRARFTTPITEEFIDHCTEGALSIEVWGHRSQGFGHDQTTTEYIEHVSDQSRSIMDRWTELTRKLELWVAVHELNEQGEYTPVEITQTPDVVTGGVCQLRQGHSRRLEVCVRPAQAHDNSGTLPVIVDSIQHVSIGCVCARNKLQKGEASHPALLRLDLC